jgi:flavodoxin
MIDKNRVEYMKKLVVFYSYDRNTRFISNSIAKSIKADVLELKPINEMNSKGFLKYFWGGKKVLFKEKPKLQPFNKNPEEYDIIFIGTPVWAFTYAPALRTFFSNVVLKDKKIAVFCCHEGSMRKTLTNMIENVSDNEIVGMNDFLNPLKNNKEQNKAKAMKWSVDSIKQVS